LVIGLCKNGGYIDLKDSNSFKNQGQCVGYVESKGKSGGKR
jgi:hypothetical protein